MSELHPLRRIRLFILMVCLTLIACLASFPGQALSADPTIIVVGLGESNRIQIEAGKQVHLSDGSIVRSRVSGREIIFTGRRIGRANLRIFGNSQETDRTIYVVDRKVARGIEAMMALLASMRGLKLDVELLPNIVVGGELLRLKDWELISKFASEHDIPWLLKPELSPAIATALSTAMKSQLENAQAQAYPLTIAQQRITLSVPENSSVGNPGLTSQQKKQVGTLGIEVLPVSSVTSLEPLVRTRIVIAEVKKSEARRLGIKPPDAVEAELLPEWKLGLTARIEAMEQVGDGKILAMPNLLCRSGGEAKFLAGGELPIKITTSKTSHVDWRKYGIQLMVKPIADAKGRMKIELLTEISTLDGAVAADGVPGLLINRIETQFNLSGSRTIVLSGLLKREESKSASGLPLLRSLPVLGRLFESRSFSDGLTELIAFVTPEVISPDAEAL